MPEIPFNQQACDKCGHPFDPHALVATYQDDPMHGGVIVCPELGCECYSTWSLKGTAVKRIPDRFEVERIREIIQSA